MKALTDGPLPQWLHDGHRHVWQPYTQHQTAPLPAPVVASKGTRIQLADGRWLIDGVASWWTAVHGHAHPHLLGAVHRQLDTLPHVMFGSVAHAPASTLARRLAQLLPGDLNHVFFAESGSVSVEVAMKMAVQFHLNRGQRRTRFLGFHHGYHGDTLATMSVCDPDRSMHAHFAGFLPEQLHTALPTDAGSLAALEQLLAEHHTSLAAVMVEPLIQGAGGFRMHTADTLRHLRRLCDQYERSWDATRGRDHRHRGGRGLGSGTSHPAGSRGMAGPGQAGPSRDPFGWVAAGGCRALAGGG